MSLIAEVFRLLKTNWKTLLIFELLQRIFTGLVIFPAFRSVFSGILKVTGIEYLAPGNYLQFFLHPLTLLFIFVLLFAIAFYAVIDIGAVIYILDLSKQKITARLIPTFIFSIKNALRVFKLRNLLLMPMLLFMVIFLKPDIAAGISGSMVFPKFLMENVNNSWYIALPLYTFFFILTVGILHWMFAFHFFTLEKNALDGAHKKSTALGASHRIKDISIMLAVHFLLVLLQLARTALGNIIIELSRFMLNGFHPALSSLSAVALVLLLVAFITILTMSMPFGYAVISVLFYAHKESREESVPHLKARAVLNRRKAPARLVVAGLFATAVILCSYYTYGVNRGVYTKQYISDPAIEITAHRGASSDYPENTIAAVEGAVLQGADWAEIDVQQSADGRIFLMHDKNFKRTCGVDKNSWEADYDEIRTYDAGSFFSEDFAGEKIPLLEDVIDYAKYAGMKLNIELKPNEHSIDMERHVADIINERGFKDSCVVSSLNYTDLERMKKCDPDIETMYISVTAVNGFEYMKAADSVSVEISFANQDVINRLHDLGHEVTIWTADTGSQIKHMIDLGADNVITNNIILARELSTSGRVNSVLTRSAEALVNFFI